MKFLKKLFKQPIGTLIYPINDPDSHRALQYALKSKDMASVLYKIFFNLPKQYEGTDKEPAMLEFQREVRELLLDHNIYPDELTE